MNRKGYKLDPPLFGKEEYFQKKKKSFFGNQTSEIYFLKNIFLLKGKIIFSGFAFSEGTFIIVSKF